MYYKYKLIKQDDDIREKSTKSDGHLSEFLLKIMQVVSIYE